VAKTITPSLGDFIVALADKYRLIHGTTDESDVQRLQEDLRCKNKAYIELETAHKRLSDQVSYNYANLVNRLRTERGFKAAESLKLQQELAASANEKDSLEASIQVLVQEKQALQSKNENQVKAAQEEQQALRSKYNTLVKAALDKQHAVRSENTVLVAEQRSLQMEKKDAEQKLNEENSRIKQLLTKRTTELQVAEGALSRDRSNAAQEKQRLKTELDMKIQRLSNDKESLEAVVRGLRITLRKYGDGNQSLSVVNETREVAIQALSEQKDNLGASLQQARDMCGSLEAENKVLKGKERILEAEKQVLESENHALKSENEAFKSENQGLNFAKDGLNGLLQDADRQLESTRKDLKLSIDKVKDLEASVANLRSQSAADKVNADDEADKLATDLSEVQLALKTTAKFLSLCNGNGLPLEPWFTLIRAIGSPVETPDTSLGNWLNIDAEDARAYRDRPASIIYEHFCLMMEDGWKIAFLVDFGSSTVRIVWLSWIRRDGNSLIVNIFNADPVTIPLTTTESRVKSFYYLTGGAPI